MSKYCTSKNDILLLIYQIRRKDIMKWYLSVLKKYAEFSGRASRREYWMFVLINILISIGVSIIGNMIKMPTLTSLYSLAVLLPSLAVGVRRLHDIGKSGWMLLVSLIPLIGIVWLIILMATSGDEGENEYGMPPVTEPMV